jgi:hypothetical protein
VTNVVHLAAWCDEQRPTPKPEALVCEPGLWGDFTFVVCTMLDIVGPKELARILRDTAKEVRGLK